MEKVDDDDDDDDDIVPMHMGVNRLYRVTDRTSVDCPHAHGGEPSGWPARKAFLVLSPCTWG